MPRPRRSTLRTIAYAAGALLSFVPLAASSARAGDLSLGLQSGMYRPQVTDPLDATESISDTSFFLSPIVDLTFGRFGVTTKYIYSNYVYEGVGSPDTLPGGQTSINRNAQKHDLDGAVKYSLFLSNEFPFAVTPFVGVRYELQNVTDGVPTRVGPEIEVAKADYTILSAITGATFSYTFRDLGLTPYAVGSVYVYSLVDASKGVDLPPNPNGFGGFAVEGGLSYSLYSLLQAPVSFTASYRYQRIEPEKFKEEIQQAIGGVFYHFVDFF